MLNLLSALQQADTAFPSGGFAFSNGMEGLAASGAALDGAGLSGVLTAVLRHRWAPCDRIALALAWRAGADAGPLAAIDGAIEAATVPETLRQGSRRNGAALLAAHVRLATRGAAALQAALDDGRLLGHLPVLQGVLWLGAGLDQPTAILVSGYTLASGMVSAAVRLGCLGTLAAQGALGHALPLIAALAATPVAEADLERLAGSLPWLDAACARHQTAALRLFAS